jgi:hypothetical protein
MKPSDPVWLEFRGKSAPFGKVGRATLLHEAKIATETSLEAARAAQEYKRLAAMKLKRKPKDQIHD